MSTILVLMQKRLSRVPRQSSIRGVAWRKAKKSKACGVWRVASTRLSSRKGIASRHRREKQHKKRKKVHYCNRNIKWSIL